MGHRKTMANCECHNQRETDSRDLRILSPACGRSLAEQGLGRSQASGKTTRNGWIIVQRCFPMDLHVNFHSSVMLIYVDLCWFMLISVDLLISRRVCVKRWEILCREALCFCGYEEKPCLKCHTVSSHHIFTWFYMYQMEVNANDYNTSHANGVWKSVILDFCDEISSYTPWRIHGAGIYMLTWVGYIDGIHGTPYMAAPWIRHGSHCSWSMYRCLKSPWVFMTKFPGEWRWKTFSQASAQGGSWLYPGIGYPKQRQGWFLLHVLYLLGKGGHLTLVTWGYPTSWKTFGGSSSPSIPENRHKTKGGFNRGLPKKEFSYGGTPKSSI